MVGFAILAYYEYERKNIPMAIVFVGLELLFQPLAKVDNPENYWLGIFYFNRKDSRVLVCKRQITMRDFGK